jgi:flagellar hook protein FlgE
MDPIATARYGLMAASRRFEASAVEVSRQGVEGEPADLESSTVEMISAKHAFEANLTTIRFAQDMWDSLLKLQSR